MTEPSVQPPQPQTPPSTNPWSDALSYPLATLGACVGAALGVLAFKLALQSGFYAIILIGLLAGWGAALLSRRGTLPIGIIAALITAIVALWAEWKFGKLIMLDDSFTYFLRNLREIGNFRLLSHTIGIALALWVGARK